MTLWEDMQKTKRMLHVKYWFPVMNLMIDELTGECCEYQVITSQHTEQPMKPSLIPHKPWEEISIDFEGPYWDVRYCLVVVDTCNRTTCRYLEVEEVPSTSFKPTQAKLKQFWFSHHVIPQHVDSDSGVPVNLNILLNWRDSYTIHV